MRGPEYVSGVLELREGDRSMESRRAAAEIAGPGRRSSGATMKDEF
jgi:hypothetical protein